MTINQFLVKKLSIKNIEAIEIIKEKRVLVNGENAIQKQLIKETDQIIFDGNEIQAPKGYRYFACYKPRGIECTLSPLIENNLQSAFPFAQGLFPVGRLDKESEGLLLLTDDGRLYKKIASAENMKEKEYIVEVDKIVSEQSLKEMSEGVIIMGKKTRPCKVKRVNDFAFSIILTQGLNRQIRRMCYKLGYEVTLLKRTRITSLHLGTMKEGEYRTLRREEVSF